MLLIVELIRKLCNCVIAMVHSHTYNNKRMIGKAHYDVATVDRLVKMEMG
jgi:hypothetical protein